MPKDVVNQESPADYLRHRVRHLHWFRQYFYGQADELGHRFNFSYRIDDRQLAQAFFNWADAFASERADSSQNRPDFAIFAGGLMLRELCRIEPARLGGEPQLEALIPQDPAAAVCKLWPEGLLYVNYCMTMVKTILEQELEVRTADTAALIDLRVWESFHENVREDPNLAIPFFDVFMGVKPNWDFPEHFASRVGARTGRLVMGPETETRRALPEQ